ncbi:MAG: hypothetical protein EOP06_18540, partial [Proteobacteria bacterium]
MHKRVLITHIPYDWPGGEDQHVTSLVKAYSAIGFEVRVFTGQGLQKDLSTSFQSIISSGVSSYKAELDAFNPSLVHLHNIFPVLGPALLASFRRRSAPVVMTAHNHRLFCSNGLAYRKGAICELCVNAKTMWRPAIYNCNGDQAKSLYYAGALTRIREANLWHDSIDAWIAPSPYMMGMLNRQGVPDEKIFLIPHNVDFASTEVPERDFDFIFAGRLSVEKGVENLI